MQKRKMEALWIPKLMILPLILAFSWNNLVYFGSRLITSDWKHINAEIFIDHKIPFVPWTVIFYLSCYLFWLVNYVIGSRQDRREAFRLLAADFFAKTICLLCFLLFPTTNTRPFVEGANIWEKMMLSVYAADAADNLFPSIHCLTSWFCYIAIRKNLKIHSPYKVFSLIYALCVCISTLTTKQHVILDMIGGVFLAEFSYYFVYKVNFVNVYERIMVGLGRVFRLVPPLAEVESLDWRSDVE